MSDTKVILSPAVRASFGNSDKPEKKAVFRAATSKLEKKAAAVAETITVPAGIEFARFEHGGRTYALSARIIVEVEALENRVPHIVIRSSQSPAGRKSSPPSRRS